MSRFQESAFSNASNAAAPATAVTPGTPVTPATPGTPGNFVNRSPEWHQDQRVHAWVKFREIIRLLDQWEAGELQAPPTLNRIIQNYLETRYPDIAEAWLALRPRYLAAQGLYKAMSSVPQHVQAPAHDPAPTGRNLAPVPTQPRPMVSAQPRPPVMSSRQAPPAALPQPPLPFVPKSGPSLRRSVHASSIQAHNRVQKRRGQRPQPRSFLSPKKALKAVGKFSGSFRTWEGQWDATAFKRNEKPSARPGGRAPWAKFADPVRPDSNHMRGGKYFNLLWDEDFGACYLMYGPGNDQVCPHAGQPIECMWNHAITLAQLQWVVQNRNVKYEFIRHTISVYNARLPASRATDRLPVLPERPSLDWTPGLGRMMHRGGPAPPVPEPALDHVPVSALESAPTPSSSVQPTPVKDVLGPNIGQHLNRSEGLSYPVFARQSAITGPRVSRWLETMRFDDEAVRRTPGSPLTHDSAMVEIPNQRETALSLFPSSSSETEASVAPCIKVEVDSDVVPEAQAEPKIKTE